MALLALSVSAGCKSYVQQPEVIPSRYATMPPREVPEVLRGTILEIADLADTEPRQVSGYGLVVNLDGTGDTTAPNLVREYMLKQMVKRGFGSKNLPGFEGLSPERVLRDPRVAIVRVDGFVPPGAIKGQRMDVQVSVIPNNNTTSLARGELYLCELKPGGANPYSPDSSINAEANARGSIFVNPAYALDGADTSGAGRLSLRYGMVIGGGIAQRDRPLVLRVRTPSPGTARFIERRIDLAFQSDTVAAAQDEGVVLINVPRKYGDDWRHFAGVVMHTYLSSSSQMAAVKARQLADAAVLPDAPLENISYAWEALGEPALPFVLPLMTHASPDVQFAAARAAAFVGEPAAATALQTIATTREHPFQLNAVETLARLPNSPMVAGMLRELLDVDDTLVRVAAYEALAKKRDPAILSNPLEGRYLLDIVPGTGRPLVYAARGGIPRIALLGAKPTLSMPITFGAMDNRMTITSDFGDKTLTVYYRPPGREAMTVQSRPDLAEFIGRLSGVDETSPGPKFGYGTMVALLQKLASANLIVAGAGPRESAGTQLATFMLEDVQWMQDAIDSAPPIEEDPRPQGNIQAASAEEPDPGLTPAGPGAPPESLAPSLPQRPQR
jgi:hypothetical protein